MSRKSNTIYLLVFGAIILIGIGVFAWWIYEKIADVSGVIKSAEANIALSDAKREEFSKVTSEISKFKDQTGRVEAVFLKEEIFVNFLELLESMSKEAGTKIKMESARLPQANEPANVVFSLEGNFSQIIKFFILLDHMPIAGIVNNMEIYSKTARAGEKISSDMLSAKATYTIFSFKEK